MNGRVSAAVFAATVSACVVIVDPPITDDLQNACRLPDGGLVIMLPDGGMEDVPPDAGITRFVPYCPRDPIGIGFGDGGGGGGGGDGGGGGGDDLDGSIDFGDGGGGITQGPIPGTGKDGDNGTAVLVMVRVDQGTANIATNLQDMLKQIADALGAQGLAVQSVAVAEMYANQRIWASRVGQRSPPALANVLRSVSASRSAAAPTACSSIELGNQGATAWSWNQDSITPFSPLPAALLVVLVDPGARPNALASCATSSFSAEPVSWFPLQRKYRRAQTRFLMIATPENGDAAAMRAHCLAVPNFPVAALDVVAPSVQPFFDPWAAQMNAVENALAARVDLCDALGSGAQGIWANLAKQWYQTLSGLR
jgi:hypothetical protein